MIKICPRCQSRYGVSELDIDYVHPCNVNGGASSTLINEDVVLYGDWTDYTGEGRSPYGTNVLLQGMASKNWGQRSFIEGARVPDITSRGNHADTTRERKHLEYIRLKEEQ